jgi:hypothetical protein
MGPADILADMWRQGFNGPLGLGPAVRLADSGGKGLDLRKRAHRYLLSGSRAQSGCAGSVIIELRGISET